MKQDREAVKTLAIAVGVREAARQTGINENTILSWSKRDHWFKDIITPKPSTITNPNNGTAINAIKPSVALASLLEQDSNATRIGFSRAARKVAEAVAELPHTDLRMPKEALVAKSWSDVAGKVHKWDKDDARSSPLNLNVLSQNTVISIGDKSQAVRDIDP